MDYTNINNYMHNKYKYKYYMYIIYQFLYCYTVLVNFPQLTY